MSNKTYNKKIFSDTINFDQPYFNDQIITYLGNKRSLLPFINEGIEEVKQDLEKEKLVCMDGFAGSGVVARLLKYHSKRLWVNDLEKYSRVINGCYLANKSELDLNYISNKIQWLNKHKLDDREEPGFIEKNYAPEDDDNIKEGERVFYTNYNAKIIDNIKRLIFEEIEEKSRSFFLAPLLVEASIHVNTSGVFKGFHKKDGKGHFGGSGEHALGRIKGEINLDVPVFSETECEVEIKQKDINKLIREENTPKFDLVYYDPPYNQHPYGSNYFMLNIIANKDKVEIQEDGVSGIMKNWNRSNYNKSKKARQAIKDLIANTPSRYILFSYNNEGLVPKKRLRKILENYGEVKLMSKEYNTYRGSRNLQDRNLKVDELLWIIKKEPPA